ncbi:MAG: metallophosphoesterase [Gemmatimonadetes bacterium]|nr:metallophosphoesterase [Gemmatimonadota bacterium]
MSAPVASSGVRLLHLSDLHCGRPFVGAHVDAALALAERGRWDAIILSGDVSQRARVAEFTAARAILDRLGAVAPLLVVPGNHDAAWWRAPFGLGDPARVHERYRAFITPDLEPVLRVPGVTVVGMNSAGGTAPHTLTWYPRDWRVKGGVTAAQLAVARARLAAAPPGDLRVLVLHHNVVRGRLSRRWGLARPEATLDALAAMAPDVVCGGHDHEERTELVVRPAGRFLVSCANTLSSRMRGRRPSSCNVIEADAGTVTVRAWVYNGGAFHPGPQAATLSRALRGADAVPAPLNPCAPAPILG